MVSSCLFSSALHPLRARTAARSRTNGGASKLGRMARRGGKTEKNYSADWDAGLSAPMSAVVPEALGGLRLDQALARIFPQYSRNRLQEWLASGHIAVG